MKNKPQNPEPADAAPRRAVEPIVCYPIDTLPAPRMDLYQKARKNMTLIDELVVPPRDARCWSLPAGHFCRIVSVEGSQVGDLNFWNAENLSERFYSGKTRALHGTHVSTGDQLWSTIPYIRPLATVTYDTLDWYGWDQYGGSVHDVIGTRCDPYTNDILTGVDYHYCCHSNLSRALAVWSGISLQEAEMLVHDVCNIFMATGFMPDTKQYFMKASPVRPGDYIEFFAELNLIGGLSACPGGDCSTGHSSDEAACFPLKVEIYKPLEGSLAGWKCSEPNGYSRTHGT